MFKYNNILYNLCIIQCFSSYIKYYDKCRGGEVVSNRKNKKQTLTKTRFLASNSVGYPKDSEHNS